MRLWVLLKPSVLASFLLGCSGWESMVLPHYCQMRIEIHIPLSALLASDGECSSSLLGGGGSFSFPLALLVFLWLRDIGVPCYCFSCGLHWHHSMGSGLVTTEQWGKSWLSTKPLLTLFQWEGKGYYITMDRGYKSRLHWFHERGLITSYSGWNSCSPIFRSLSPRWQWLKFSIHNLYDSSIRVDSKAPHSTFASIGGGGAPFFLWCLVTVEWFSTVSFLFLPAAPLLVVWLEKAAFCWGFLGFLSLLAFLNCWLL